ncbi:MAG: hypothetical protein ACJA1A_002639 [Saprospiraceae bacterium]
MNIFRRILSLFLLSIYVLSGAHGAIVQCEDSNHQHEKHNHEHSHDHHEGNDEISVSHSIIHSVVHFIEHLAHDHDNCIKVLVVDNDNSNNYNSDIAAFRSECKRILTFTIKNYPNSKRNGYSSVYLVHSSLRGPPAIV